MRLVSGVLALALFAPVARADGPAAPEPAATSTAGTEPAAGAASGASSGASSEASSEAANRDPRGRPPLRVVRVMPESHQALLFDRGRATHVLAEVGGQLDGYTVEDIDDDTVILRRDGREVVLTAPPRGGRRRYEADATPARPTAVQPPAPRGPAPVDPYGDDAIRTAIAPDTDGAAGSAATGAPSSAATDPTDARIRVARAPSASAAPASWPPLTAGEGGIRVVEAPGAPAGAIAPALVASAPSDRGATSLHPVRAAEPPAVTALPPSPSGEIAPAPDDARLADAAPRSPERLRIDPASPASAAAAIPPPNASAAREASGATAASPADARATAPAPSAPRGTPDQVTRATDDARALADVLTTDRRSGSPRAPAPGVASEAARAAAPQAAAPIAAAPADARAGDALVLSRGELDRALADFAGLTAGVRGSFSPAGVVVESVGPGTLFQRAGLRAGDVITAIDGVRLRSLDDAANLYARAATAKSVTAQVVRGGRPVALRVVIQ